MGFNTGAATVHPTTTNHDRDTEYDTSTVDIINNDDLKENRDGGDGDYYDNNNNNNNQQKKLLKGDFKEYKGKFASCFKSLEFALIALLTTITMLALVSMAVIGIGFYWSTIKSNMERSRKIAFTELTQVTTLSIKAMTDAHMAATALLANRDYYDFANDEDSLRFTWALYKSLVLPGKNEIVASIYTSLDNGAIAGYIRAGAPNEIDKFNSYQDPSVMMYGTVIDFENGDFNATTADPLPVSNEDMNGIWLTTGREINGSHWSVSYLNAAFPGRMWISFISSFRDPVTNDFLGLLGSDCTTDSLGRFLEVRSKIFTNDKILIVERKTGYLIATSNPAVRLYIEHEDGTTERRDGKDSGDTLLQETILIARDQYGNSWEGLGESLLPKYTMFTLHGRRYLLNVQRFVDDYGIDWVIIESLPITNFTKKFNDSLGILIAVAFILLVIGVIASAIAAKVIMKPLFDLMVSAIMIENMELEDVQLQLLHNPAYFYEIRRLQKSYFQMTKRLVQFRSFIPDHILAVIEQESMELKESYTASRSQGSHPKDDEHSQSSIVSSMVRGNSTKLSSKKTSSGRMKSSKGESSHHHHRSVGNSAFQIGLSESFLTVMTITMTPYLEFMKGDNWENLVAKVTGEYVSMIHNLIRVTQGQFVKSNYDEMIIVWNAQMIQDDHILKACKTARNCQEKLKNLSQQWSTKKFPIVNAYIGIACGSAYYGNLGCDKMKFFSVIGQPYDHSSRLSRLNQEYGTKILCNAKVASHIKGMYQTRQLLHDEQHEDWAVYQIGEPIESKSDEWMYEMQEQERLGRWTKFSQAFELYRNKNYSEAFSAFESYLEQDPEDPVTMKLMAECQDRL